MPVDLSHTFEKYEDEYLKFDRVENKPNKRPDICAFLLIDKLLPHDGRDMVCVAEHDQIWLDADCEKLAEVATDDDILALVRCGVLYEADTDSLTMYA